LFCSRLDQFTDKSSITVDTVVGDTGASTEAASIVSGAPGAPLGVFLQSASRTLIARLASGDSLLGRSQGHNGQDNKDLLD